MMVKVSSECEDLWMDEDIFVESRKRDRPKKTRQEVERINNVDQDIKAKALERLYELGIPKSDESLLAKLISNGKLKSVDKIVVRKKKSLILSGTACRKHRDFPMLSSEAVIIKIPINNVSKEESWQRSYAERLQNKFNEETDNHPTFLLQTGHIIVTTMIGENGEPAPTLIDVLNSNERSIAKVYDEIIEFWCKIRNRPFHPSNFLYHNDKWWRVGHVEHAYDTFATGVSVHCLSFYRSNLKHIIDFFCRYGLSMKQAEDGFMKYAGKYYWSTTEVMRGMTRKRSFFSIMYMGQSND